MTHMPGYTHPATAGADNLFKCRVFQVQRDCFALIFTSASPAIGVERVRRVERSGILGIRMSKTNDTRLARAF